MPKKNTVSEIKKAVRLLRAASARILQSESAGELCYAATLCPSLCARARSAAKSMASYKSLPAAGEEWHTARALAEAFLESGEEASEAKLMAFLASRREKYGSIALALLPDALFASAFLRIAALVSEGEETGLSYYLRTAERLHFVDFTRIFLAFSATVAAFSGEKAGVYAKCDDKTKLKYISALLALCRREGKTEAQKAAEVLRSADSGGAHVGTLLLAQRAYVPRVYSLCLAFFTLLITVMYFLLCGSGTIALLTAPAAAIACYGMGKELLSLCFRHAGGEGLMRLAPAWAKKEKAVVAVMAILSGGESDGELFERLEDFYLSEENANRFYAIVFNLPDSEKKSIASDEKTVLAAFSRIEALRAKYGPHFGIFMRRRRYSRSEGKYIGWERKRGAVLELCRFMRGEKTSICRYIADKGFLAEAKYLITLDADTNLYAGASDELVGTMLHPMNTPVVRDGAVVSGHAVVQPHIAPTLESAAGSAFATVTAGNGGIDSYAGAAFDVYENVFGGGSFCGKGILDVDVFLSVCDGFFPGERILSHDLLEGNLMGAAIASDITLTDSAPKNALAYYTRQHRWVRGDLQTVPYLFPYVKNAHGEKMKNPMRALEKYKILDNLISALCPLASLAAVFSVALASREALPLAVLFLFANIIFPVIRALLALFLPGGAKKAARRFHSRVMPHIWGGLCYSFYKLCALPYEAFIFADAAVRTAYRFAVSKRNFLNWKTAAAAEREKNGFLTYLRRMWASPACGALALCTGSLTMAVLGLLWLSFPFYAFLLSLPRGGEKEPSAGEREKVSEYAAEMWGFFRDNVCEETNFLPPDNRAYSPAERVAYRTSPTNIGLYLASLLGARDLGLITSAELLQSAERTARALLRMQRWRGHFYNWYDIRTLDILGEPFVSAVDSGNLAVALAAFCEGLGEYTAELPALSDTARTYEAIVKEMDFAALYNPGARLFHIGYDVKNEKYSSSFYDTFMSESRMTSFFAVATGQVPREHFFAPSRTLVGSGAYVGVASWSGTVFEYFMPALFLPTVKSSLSAEALSFALRMAKKNAVRREFFGRRRRIFGVSESGYWQFDAEMNYQYKAFGTGELSLDPAGRSAPVISPYSSFLMLRCGIGECLQNLETLERMGAHGEYGFYEAVDCEKSRVGGGFAVVKSYMAHHVGMSFLSSVNLLCDDIFVKRFMRIPKMRAFKELLCEKINVQGVILPKKARMGRAEKEMLIYRAHPLAQKAEIAARFNLLFPEVAMLSNNKLRLLASSSGHIAVYNGENVLLGSDFERFGLGGGLRFLLWADGTVYPLVPLSASGSAGASTFGFEHGDDKIKYTSRHARAEGTLCAELCLSVCGDREMFSAECRVSGSFRKAYLYVYGEPIVGSEKSFLAHKSFYGLFLESKYSEDEDVLLFARRPKQGIGEKSFLGVKAFPHVYGGDFDTARDEILPLMYGERDIAALAEKPFGGTQGAMIVPALSMRTYRAGAKGLCGFVFAAAQSEEEALFLLSEESRFSQKRFAEVCRLQYGAAGLGKSHRFLKNYLLRSFIFRSAPAGKPRGSYARDVFWRHGISGERHSVLALLPTGDESELRELSVLIRVFKYMCICGERFDLIVLHGESDLYRKGQRGKIEFCAEREGCRDFLCRDGGIHPLSEEELGAEEKEALSCLCDAKINLSVPLSSLRGRNESFFEISAEAERALLAGAQTRAFARVPAPRGIIEQNESGFFTEKGFAVRKGEGGAPFATVAANEKFGFVATENSLGFSYYENSALGKLTPHTADAMKEDAGERLILRVYADFEEREYEDFDLCATASFAEFGENRVRYRGNIRSAAYTVEVCPDAVKPVKRISVSLVGGESLRASLFFLASPCLGERRQKAGRYVFDHAGKCIFAHDVSENPVALALACTAEDVRLFSDEAAVLTDGRIFLGVGDIAAVCARTSRGADFYLAAICADFSGEELERFVFGGGFCPCPPAPIFENVRIKTGRALFDHSVNLLFPYQTYYSRFTARAGFYQVGGAYGFRDQLQDSLSFIENAPELCRAQILRAAAHQYREGDAAHWWHAYAGRETGLRSRYSDDLLWLPFALCEYVEKTGDAGILSERAPYLGSPVLDAREHERYEALDANGEGSVLEHALIAARLVWARGFGAHGLLKIGGGDWNDGMNNVGARGEGESVWLTEFCAIVYHRLAHLMRGLGDEENAAFFEQGTKQLFEGFKGTLREGWYLRGYYDSGAPLGRKGDEECEVDSLSQSFAVFAEAEITGEVSAETKNALAAAMSRLYDERHGLIKLLSPPFDAGGSRPGYIKGYLPGIRENGGQYTHAAVWAAMATLTAGESEKGTQMLMSINTAVRSTEAGFCRRYKIEPYALAGDVYAHPERILRGGWSHYTGAAAWYRKAVLETLFGFTLRGEVFFLRPHMPPSFDGAELSLFVRSTRYLVRFSFACAGGAVLDGKILESDEEKMKKCPFPLDGGEHTLDYCMKKKG